MIQESEKKSCFSPQEIEDVQKMEIPQHIAIIMDGNRRWAKKHALLPTKGHWEGAKNLLRIVEAASELKISLLTVFAFSTENWVRSKFEVETLMQIFQSMLKNHKQRMINEGIRLSFIGDLSGLSLSLRGVLEEVREATQGGKTIDLVLALNYGGRDELRRAMQAIAIDFKEEKIKLPFTEKLIATYLDTASFGEPDLLIRTSGESRLSNFLLWQLAYTEMVLTDILWPDFSPHELLGAIRVYQKRQRRKGG